MIVHFFPNEKFTATFINRTNSLFPVEDHLFLIYANNNNICKKEDAPYENVLWVDHKKDAKMILRKMREAGCVVIHSLPSYAALLLLFQAMMTSKAEFVWSIWGADLYDKFEKNHAKHVPVKSRLEEFLRRCVIQRFHRINAVKGDFDYLCQCYKVNGKNINCGLYYEFKEIELITTEHERTRIMIGHSATESCRHLETFELLLPYKDEIEVYCPLAYPTTAKEYIGNVEAKGKELFGEHFIAQKDFCPLDEYMTQLNYVDVGIFNNNRQQGMGNISALLYLGKRVMLSKDNTLLDFYQEMDAAIDTISEESMNEICEPLLMKTREKNRAIVRNIFSDENFVNKWQAVYGESVI